MTDRSILIIERDEQVQRSLAETLSGLGCALALVSGPREAAEALAVQAPDLVILGMDPDPAVAAVQHEQIQELTDTGVAVACLVQRTDGPEAEQVRLSGAADLIDRGRIEDVLEAARRLLPPADDEAPSQRRRSTMRVLVIEDDAVQRRLIEACLQVAGRERVEVAFCGTAGEARQQILEGRFDCILLDHILPDGNGLEILEDLEEHLLTTPVIGLSATASADVALEYFRAGCCDFLCKDDVLMADQLRRRIADSMSRFHRRAMATIIERRELGRAIVQSQDRLISLARTDHLTGVCNRAVFDDYLPGYHRQAVEEGGTYALVLVDVDRFKQFNDHYGHAAGDQALRSVAEALQATLRENDFLARYGGEELVLVLEGVTGEHARSVLERFRTRLVECGIPHELNEGLGCVTASFGAALHGPGCGRGPQEMIQRADQALYRAKAAGRNCVVIDPEPGAAAA